MRYYRTQKKTPFAMSREALGIVVLVVGFAKVCVDIFTGADRQPLRCVPWPVGCPRPTIAPRFRCLRRRSPCRPAETLRRTAPTSAATGSSFASDLELGPW